MYLQIVQVEPTLLVLQGHSEPRSEFIAELKFMYYLVNGSRIYSL
jgi:hypothetical protein